MDIKNEVDRQFDIFVKGAVDIISDEELKNKIERSIIDEKPLKIKYGADPSSSDMHLGHTVPLRKLRAIQDLGHEIIFLIGDFTAMVGDPTGRSETRKMLTKSEVEENAKTYQEQVFKILNKEKTKVVYNSDWLEKFSSYDFMSLVSRYTVARLLERDDFKKRFEENRPISLVEFIYPLLQGYDSVVLESDLEIGGTDQKFNLLVGRVLQRDYGKSPQVVITLPIIEGTDGVRKMSKTFGNSINITDSPKDMFGKIMSIPDNLIVKYYTYLTDKSSEEINEIKAKLDSGSVNPKNVKMDLGTEVVSFYYSADKALAARDEFDKIFRDKGVPDDIGTFLLSGGENIADLLFRIRLVPSKSEARRLIKQGAVKIDNNKITDINYEVVVDGDSIIQCGRRKFAKIVSK